MLDLKSVEVIDASVYVGGPGDVELTLSGLGVRVSGRLASPEETRLQAEIVLPVPKSEESKNVRVKNTGVSVAAGLKLSVSLEGRGRVTARGELGLDRLVLTPGGVPQSFSLTFQAQGDLARGEFELSALELRQAEHSLLRASGRLSGESDGRRARLDIEHLALFAPGSTWLFGLVGLDPSGLGVSGTTRLSSVRADWEMAAGGLPSLAGDLIIENLGVRLGGIRLSRGRGTLHLKVGPGEGASTVLSVAGPVRAGAFSAGNLRIAGPDMRLAVEAELRPEPESWSVALAGIGIEGRMDRFTASSLTVDGLSFNSRLTGRDLRPDGAGWRWGRLSERLSGSARSVTVSGKRLTAPSFSATLSGAGLGLRAATGPTLDGLSGELTLESGRFQGAGLTVTQPRLTVEVSAGGLSTGRRFGRPLRLKARLRTGRLASGPLAEAIDLALDTSVSGLGFSSLPVELDLGIKDIELGRGDGKPPWRLPGLTRIQLAGTIEPRLKKFSLDRFEAGFGTMLTLQASGTLDGRQPGADVTFRTSKHRMEELVASLPEDVKAVLPPLKGQVQLTGRFYGRLAAVTDYRRMPFAVELTVDNQDVSFELPSAAVEVRGLSGPVRLSAGKPEDPRVRSSVRLTVERIGLMGLGAAGIEARDVTIGLASALAGEELMSDGRVTAARIDAGGLWPRPLRGVQLDFASLLTGFKDLRLTELSVALDSAGLALSGHGQVVWTPGAAHWSDLRLSLQTRTRFASDEPVDFPGGLKALGRAELQLGLKSVSPGVLSTEGRFTFSGLSVEGPGFAFEGVHGGIPISQFIRVRPQPGQTGLLARGGDRRGGEDSVRSSAYEQALRPLKGESRTFSIQKLRFKDLVFSDLSGNLELAGGVLSLGSLRFGFLHGDVVADTVVAFAPANELRLDLDAEMSGIDLSGLGALTLAGSSDVSGNLRLGLDLNQQDLRAAFNLTQIGRSTLQAFLVALDPRESNPGLVAIRNYLDNYKVSPREVNLDIRHGLLSMRIELDMGPLAKAAAGFVQGFQGDTFAITHIPVSGFLSKYIKTSSQFQVPSSKF